MKRLSGRGKQGRKGFTLIEVVVVLAIVALLAAILTPLLIKYLDDAKIGRAKNEALVIGTAILNFNKDTGVWPIYAAGGGGTAPPARTDATHKVLRTNDGTNADVNSSVDASSTGANTWNPSSNTDTYENQLEKNTPGGSTAYRTSGQFAWKGPYQSGMTGDPWGNKYYSNVEHLQPGASNRVVWVLSSGPNRQIETSYTVSATASGGAGGSEPGGDDIGFRIR
ncbi:MAG: prepilin-type N-terminal cleavage/methylation domain-containing protein [Deltaproteobacteria bacterium]|nr:prepilin-type N-terminal cleavage/methylation domain-containing protein [Deltaproteobacteria bacterium]